MPKPQQQTEPTAQRTQLAKRLSPLSVWALSLGCIIGWGSFILPGTTFLPQAGPAGTLLALAIAAVVMIIIAFNYSFLIKRYPYAGGEYSYVNATFGARHAFIMSWLLGLCYLALVAQNATALALVARNVVGGVFRTGFLYSFAGYDIYAGELCLALAALLLFAALSIRGVKLAGLFQTVLVLAIVFGVGATLAATIDQVGPQAFFAPRPAFSPITPPLHGVLVVLAIAPFLFVGFDTIPQAAEEYHFPPVKTKGLIILSLVFGALIYAALTLLASSTGPNALQGWDGYLNASADGIEGIPTFNAAQTFLGLPGIVLLSVAACGAILSGIVGFYMATSRLLFALARDGFLPDWFASVHPRYRTPHHALLFIFAVSAIAPFFGRTVLGWLVDMSALGAAVAYAYASLVTWRHARCEYKTAYQLTGALGFAFSLVFVILLLVPIPGLHASLGVESYVCLVLWIVVGAIFFLGTKRNRQGRDKA